MTENPQNNSPYGQQPNAPQYGAPQTNGAQYSAPQYGVPQPNLTPEMLKDQKQAKQYGLMGVIFGAIAFIILGFLGPVGLALGIMGLKLSNKLAAAGVQPNSKGLNIAAIIVSSISVAFWILGLILRASMG